MRMLALLTLVVASACVSSCDPDPTGADGYYFEKAQFTRSQAVVHFVPVHSDEELRQIGIKYKIRLERDILKDLVLITPDGCTIFVADPTTRYEPEWMGHALTHCLFGDFHQKQNSERK